MTPSNPAFFEQNVAQQLEAAVGQKISASEFKRCFREIELLEPASGKPFWQSVDAPPGLFIVLAGKVRLLDHNANLIASLETGESFGELTLFRDAHFQPYTARASLKLKLGFFSENCLRSLPHYNQIQDRLYQQGVRWDLLLLCRHTPLLAEASTDSLRALLDCLERHNLKLGKLPGKLQNSKLWLLRQGELTNASGQRLTAESLMEVDADPTWQVTQPTELYSLSVAHWEKIREELPQLGLQSNAGLQIPEQSGVARSRRRKQRVVNPATNGRPPKQTPPSTRKISKAYFPSPTQKIGQLWRGMVQRYPFYQQQSASDCGAACLVMIGRYWGKRFSINKVRNAASVSRSGASLRRLAAAAESIGFSTRPVKASLKGLTSQSLPAIAHWEGKHFVVVYKITRKQVIIADPAIGQRSLTHPEFERGWTGYAMLLQPTLQLKETEESHTNLWRFFELVKPHWVVLLEVFAASVLIQVFGLVTPLLTQLLLDRVVVQRSELTLTAVGLGLLIFSIFGNIMSGLRQYLLDHTANRIDISLIVGFIKHAFHLPLSYFENRYVGDIISRVQENRKIQSFLTGESLSVLLDLLTVFVYVGLMFWYSWQMALLVLCILPPYFILTLISTPILQRMSRNIFNAATAERSYLIESFSGIRTVKSMAIERNVRWHWEELFHKTLKTIFSGQVVRNSLIVAGSMIDTLATVGVLWFGAWLVIQNQLTIGQLVAFNMLLGNVVRPFQRLNVLWNQLQEVIIAVERIDDVIESEPEEKLEQERHILPYLRGHIRFEQVTFRYHHDSDINTLENISFEIQPGQTIALVGRSGSGKTTISKLVLGLYPPTDGKILIDGYDVTRVSMHSLRQQIGVVDQDTFLFGGTIRENISIGHPDAKLEEVMAAASQAGADQFIQDLPMGYETIVGEGGGTLSGGQRQRLAIARALMGNPRLLVLDEATSSLDAESERIIQNNLSTIAKNRTTLIIAHRLSTVRNADLILVLDRGVLVESGKHKELMAKRGQYFYLNQQQLSTIS